MVRFLQVLIKSFTHKRISYSYGGVDSLILNIFKDKEKGFYIDIGCGHPIKNNNTYLLNKKGWNGINIDLDEENINLFNVSRKNDFNFAAAVSDTEGEADLYITPGYNFKIIDGLITNFHLPQSTLLLLVASLVGREKLLELYKLAIDNNYRFYSYGDSMLIKA